MTQEGFKRELTAILSADVEGCSRLMGEDEEATVRTLTAYREVLTTLIQQHNGKVLDFPVTQAEFSVLKPVAVSTLLYFGCSEATFSYDKRNYTF